MQADGATLRRILIVDDSVVARAAMTAMLTQSQRFAVAAAVSNASDALSFLEAHRVDAVLLDLEMPRTNGIDALPSLIAASRNAPVLVVSTTAAAGATVTMRALAQGAADALAKPVAGELAGAFARELIARLDLIFGAPEPSGRQRGDRPARPPISFDAIAIGASTGGIHALASLFAGVPAAVRQPIFVTQHLPGAFSPFFAGQMTVSARRPCRIASDRARVEAGEMLIAPGDAHLVAVSTGNGGVATRLSRTPVASGNMPAVDPMFASLATVYGPRLLAIVLSGMGRDGLQGARAVRAAGGTVLVQDRDTSVVWGMPGAVAQQGLADAIMSPAELGAFVASLAALCAA